MNLDLRFKILDGRFAVYAGALAAVIAAACSACRTAPQPPSPHAAVHGEPSWNLEGQQPYLVAHYMPWFEVDREEKDKSKRPAPISTKLPSSWADDERDEASPLSWRHWKWDKVGPLRNPDEKWEDGRRKISSVHYPLIGPYNSRSRDVMRYHLETAKAAGIRAFLVIWYGPESFEDRQIAALLDEAKKAGMKIAICYEEKINFEGFRDAGSRDEAVEMVADDLTYIAEKYGSHPAYLKRNGMPFVMQFNSWGKGKLGPNLLTAAEWRDVFSQLPSPVFYVRQNLDEEYHPPIPGAYVWWNSDAAWLKSVAQRAEGLKQADRLEFFMTMICPGFDDTGVWGWGGGPRKEERFGLSTLKNTFDIAVSEPGHADMIQVVTWNDFSEGTAVEPSRENGFWYLDAIETWWGEKTGRPVNLADNRRPFLEYAANASGIAAGELPPEPFEPLLAERPLVIEKSDALRHLR